jgi:hypothetical protein
MYYAWSAGGCMGTVLCFATRVADLRWPVGWRRMQRGPRMAAYVVRASMAKTTTCVPRVALCAAKTRRGCCWLGGREAWVGGWDACRFVTWPDQHHFPAQPTATLLVGGAVIVACTWLVCDDDPPSPLRTATGPARSSPRTSCRHQTVSLWARRRRCVCVGASCKG